MNGNNLTNANSYDDVVREYYNAKLSRFPLSEVKSTTILPGAIVPIWCRHMLPNERATIDVNTLLQSINPLQKPSLTKWRLYTWTIYNRSSDLWKDSKLFHTKGRDGEAEVDYPTFPVRNTTDLIWQTALLTERRENAFDWNTPMSLSNYLGVPVCSYNNNPSVYATTVNSSAEADQFHIGAPVSVYEDGAVVEDVDGNDIMNNLNINPRVSSSDFNVKVSAFDNIDALPYMMYQRFCRDYKFNADLLMDNKNWYPDDDDDFIIPSGNHHGVMTADCRYGAYYETGYKPWPQGLGYEWIAPEFVKLGAPDFPSKGSYDFNDAMGIFGDMNSEPFVPTVRHLYDIIDDVTEDSSRYSNCHAPVYLGALHFAQFKGDYFTTASPFPELMRGSIPTLGDYTNDSIDSVLDGIFKDQGFDDIAIYVDSTGAHIGADVESSTTARQNFVNSMKTAIKSSNNAVTLMKIKELEVWSQFRQLMAMSDGTYNDLILSQYGYNPHVHTLKATYCGGSFTDVSFNEVVATGDSASHELGDRNCNAISLSGENKIEIFSPDFGYAMTLCCLVPDVIYEHSGIDRKIRAWSFDDIPFPITEQLGADVITNDELYVSGTSADTEPFGFAQHNAYLKHTQNTVSGLFSIGDKDLETDAYIGRRHFTVKPELNNDFVTMSPKNIQDSVMRQFSSLSKCPFILSVGISGSTLAPMSYGIGTTKL